jgi:lipopolysaccharide export system permease protein
MIFWELVKVFLLSLIGITGIMLMASIIAEASQHGLGPGQILTAIPLLIPSTLPYTIPSTTLFATCVVYGRLAADNEILAIKSAGINILHVARPAILLGVLISAATMGLYYHVIPYTHLLLRSMVFNDAEELAYSLLQKQHSINPPQLEYSIHAKEVRGRRLLDVYIKHKAKLNGQTDVVAQAREAELHIDMQNRKLVLLARHVDVFSLDKVNVDSAREKFEMDLPDNLFQVKEQRARDMTWQEMLEHRRRHEMEREATLNQITSFQSGISSEDILPEDLPQHIKNLQDRATRHQQEILFLDVEMLMRPALSVGCLCFILVGCPVGIWFSRSDYLSSFITCFLPIVFIYYPLILCGTNLAKEGKMNPIVLVWGADVLVGAIGVGLFWRLLKN